MAHVIQSADVRSRLRDALELDLIGPGAGHPLADERLPGWVRPSNWYLTGFLVPRGAPAEQRADADADDDFEPEVADQGGLGDDSTEDRRAAKKGFFPSSMGLSFLVAEGVDRLDVTVRWGDYRYVEDASRGDGVTDDASDGGESSDSADGPADGAVVKSEGKASTRWQRMAREETVPVTLAAADGPYQEPVPGSRGADPACGRPSSERYDVCGPDSGGDAFRVVVPGERADPRSGPRPRRGVRFPSRVGGGERGSVRAASRSAWGVGR